jgi:hypothetical protein
MNGTVLGVICTAAERSRPRKNEEGGSRHLERGTTVACTIDFRIKMGQ